jgi:phosphohistidine phosphatase
MKYLTVLRHGFAEPGIGRDGDFSRTLTKDGGSRLIRLGQLLHRRDTAFDLVISSSAIRTTQTTEIIGSFCEYKKMLFEDLLYEAELKTILSILQGIDNSETHVLLVGHNPGVSTLATYLTGEKFINMDPGMMVRMEFHLSDWKQLTSNTGILLEIIQ